MLGSPGKAGSSLGPIQFDQPAEIFLHSSGEIYIVDGDGGINNRLMKLSKGESGVVLSVVWDVDGCTEWDVWLRSAGAVDAR